MKKSNTLQIKVCMLISYFYPVIGGAEQQAFQLSNHLLAKGIDVSVLTSQQPNCKKYELVDNVPVNRVHILKKKEHTQSFLTSLSLFFSFSFFLIKNRKKYDIIHAHQLYISAFTASVIGRLLGKKTLAKIASTGLAGEMYNLSKTFLGRFMKKQILKLNFVIATSKGAMDELKQNGFKTNQILYIPNGVDTIRFSSVNTIQKKKLRKKLSLPINKKILLFTGRTAKKKRVDLILKAFSKIEKKRDDVFLLVVGEKQNFKVLNEIIKEEKIKNIHFTGKVNNVDEYLKSSDIYILPSVSEGLSNALLEAMSCGLPCIVTKIPGNVDLVKDGETGLLVNVDSSEEIFVRANKLLESPSLMELLSINAKNHIQQNHSFEKTTAKYVELYNFLLQRKSEEKREVMRVI